ncbi:hypothetical protein C7M61_000492 [Candidozyma pseudohaemuli]|uniref:Mitochondrial thiamine pyrophosphate carrier 1 n=1 Tax=Candidozyma pseudohaemuli TaxID=418784 RepID=A0A2P7YY20_9ASCO|nr:hypothetical protein C7M61_000492 [[Candida] pseudohaemulonii]PSK40834.1 hypothetical protein C7M61_000492 [[Candida] pseudohaemulonii]
MKSASPREDHLLKNSDVSAVESLVAGSISGAVARAITAPLDTIKIRLQLLLTHDKNSTISLTVKKLLRREGVTALWKGNVPAEILYVLYGASQFTSYSMLNNGLRDLQESFGFTMSRLLHTFTVGCGAGLASTVLTYPFDMLRTRLAASEAKQFLSMSKVAKDIYRDKGALGFFAGIRPSLLSIVASSGLFFWSYSLARSTTDKIHEQFGYRIWGVEAVCGFIAGSTAKAITFPLDTLRKRMQISHERNGFKVFRANYRNHGLFGFYRGFLVSLMKTAPTSAISVFVYEYSISATRKARVLL